jgi:hypothetical protein
MAELKLSDDELQRLTAASEPPSDSAGH